VKRKGLIRRTLGFVAYRGSFDGGFFLPGGPDPETEGRGKKGGPSGLRGEKKKRWQSGGNPKLGKEGGKE